MFCVDSVYFVTIKIHVDTLNEDRCTLQLYITVYLICFESYDGIIRDTNIREKAGR
jgi:hypothetical protein